MNTPSESEQMVKNVASPARKFFMVFAKNFSLLYHFWPFFSIMEGGTGLFC